MKHCLFAVWWAPSCGLSANVAAILSVVRTALIGQYHLAIRPSATTSLNADIVGIQCVVAFIVRARVCPKCDLVIFCSEVPALGTVSTRHALCHLTPARTLSVICFSKPICGIFQHFCRPGNQLALAICHCGLAQSLCDWCHAGSGAGAPKGHYRTSPAGKLYAETPSVHTTAAKVTL